MASKLLLALLFSINSYATGSYIPDVFHKGDDRKVYSKTSPQWLSAVGRIGEHCTGTLVASDIEENSRVVTSAYHCITRYFGSKKQDIKIVFTTPDNTVVERKAQILSPGSLQYDAVVLILDKPISYQKIQGLIVYEFIQEEYNKLTVAGYSVDQKLGRKGKQLTYDEDCKVEKHLKNIEFQNFVMLSDCSTYGGASGGPAVYSEEDFDGEIVHYIVGHSAKSDKNGTSLIFAYIDEYESSYSYFLNSVFDAMSVYNTYDE